MAIPFIFWLAALKAVHDNAKINNLVFLSPFLSLIFIHFILGEEIFFTTLTGITLIVVGIFVQQVKKRQAN